MAEDEARTPPTAQRGAAPFAARSRGRKVAYAGILLGVLLLAAEFGWRLHLRASGRGFLDDPHEFRSPFFTTYQEPPPRFTPAGIEFLDGAVAWDKPPGELRIVCLGGSTTVNFRAGISYPELLERRFREEPDLGAVRVLNAGGEGYSTAHLLVNLELRILAAKPDIVTVCENVNDLSAAWIGERVEPDYANKYLSDFYLGLRHRSGLVAELCRVSRLARSVVSGIDSLRFPAVPTDGSRDHTPALDCFRRNLRSLAAVARAHGVALVLATQPARSGFRAHAGFEAFNAAIRATASEEGVELVDLARAITDDACFLPDEIHNNRAGVEAVAAEWHATLRRMVAARRQGG